jgi:hypothetical protein
MVRPSGNDRAPLGGGCVARSAGYQVNMAMTDCLTSHSADVDAHIESFDRAIRFNNVVVKLPQ